MQNKQKLLFISNSSPNIINHILDAFNNRDDLDIEVLNQSIEDIKITLISRVFNKLKIPLDSDNLNKRLLSKMDSFNPDIIFIIKGNIIYPWVLKKIKNNYPNIKLISWSQDDMYASHSRSYYYTIGLKYYDFVITQKSYNVKELKSLGAKKVFFQNKAFSKKYHKPCKNCSEVQNKADVLFIGCAETERFNDLNYLAENGVKISVYGYGWHKHKFRNYNKNLTIYPFELLGYDYTNAISCSKISLCFLRKINRDLQTSRSIEIPACGGFMIAERTGEHKTLFEEDKEAVYFDNKEELLEKVNYYLKNEVKRKSISEAGLKRVLKDDYSFDNRVNEILKIINES